MKRQHLLAWITLAACIGTAGAQGQGGRIIFVGQVVQGTCSTSPRDGDACSVAPGLPPAFSEHRAPAPNATDAAMLDYFLERAEGAKLLATREYR